MVLTHWHLLGIRIVNGSSSTRLNYVLQTKSLTQLSLKQTWSFSQEGRRPSNTQSSPVPVQLLVLSKWKNESSVMEIPPQSRLTLTSKGIILSWEHDPSIAIIKGPSFVPHTLYPARTHILTPTFCHALNSFRKRGQRFGERTGVRRPCFTKHSITKHWRP